MPNRFSTLFTIAALLALPLAACDESPAGLSSTGTTRVQLTGVSGGPAGSASLVRFSQHAQGSGGNLSLDVVSSIDVTLETLELLKLENDEGRWVSLDVDEEEIDLLELPADGLEVARGELEAGDYCNLRLFVDAATITFSEEVTLGGGAGATTFAADEPHDLFIPSENQSGIKVPTVDLTVDEGQETVTITFDAGESVQTVNLTGRGVLMTPVLTADDDGEEIPDCDAVEDDEDEENGGNGDGSTDGGDGGTGGGA